MKQFLTRIPPINLAVPPCRPTRGVHPGQPTVPSGTSSDHRESKTPYPLPSSGESPGIPRPCRDAHDGCLESPATVAEATIRSTGSGHIVTIDEIAGTD